MTTGAPSPRRARPATLNRYKIRTQISAANGVTDSIPAAQQFTSAHRNRAAVMNRCG
jgi:hypothetical protein